MVLSPATRTQLINATFPEILGQARVKDDLKSALLANRNLIIVGPPGVGKTTLAKAVAHLMPERTVNDCAFRCDPLSPSCPQCATLGAKQKRITLSGESAFVRIQGSPDLTAEDLLGDIDPIKALQYGPLSLQAFTPGKIFRANKGILFFDEVNRCSEKLQNALLQVLEEKKVTIGSYDIDFTAEFLFIGTMNPEDTSTEKFSDVFLDRFDIITMGYPENAAIEQDIVTMRRQDIEGVRISDLLQQQVIAFVRQLREDRNLDRKPSVRASIGIVDRSLALALVRGKRAVTIDEIEAVVPSVIAHRISLKPSIRYLERPEEYLKKQFSTFVREHNMDGGDP
jgi:Mg-chelatase subunit ChlI